MMNRKRLITGILEIMIGAGLVISEFAGVLDEYWSGLGTGLIVVGVIMIIRCIRYKTDADYRENVDTQATDERNRYLSMKAWSWAGYLFVMIAAVATVVLKIVGLDEYMIFASGSVCLIMVLYWLSWMVLRKKY